MRIRQLKTQTNLYNLGKGGLRAQNIEKGWHYHFLSDFETKLTHKNG